MKTPPTTSAELADPVSRERVYWRKKRVLSIAIVCVFFIVTTLLSSFSSFARPRMRVDSLQKCPFAWQPTAALGQRTFRIFIGAGTKEYLPLAKHLVSSLYSRSPLLAHESRGITILTSQSTKERCDESFREVASVSCAAASPKFQQAGSHADVYNKLEVFKHMGDDDVNWIVYFDADMVVLGELSAVVTRIPAHYQLMGVKDFPNVFRRWHLPELCWGVNGGFFVLHKQVLIDHRDIIESQMKLGRNDQIIWSELFYNIHKQHGACVLGDEYNCRPNTHRVCHKRARVMHYSSSSKHALYYYSSANY